MKRFLFALLLVLCFSSCSLLKKDYWIAAQVYQDDILLNPYYDRLIQDYYVNVDASKNIELRYFLIPECNEQITITSLEYDDDTLLLISSDNSVITFKPLKTGTSNIKIKTKNHGTAMPLELRIKD